jgi:tripeptidyl-peptidase-1
MLFLVLLAAVASAARVTLENVAALPAGWTLNATADANDTLTVSLALKQPKLAELKRRLVSSRYSRRQIHDYRRPDRTAVDSVLRWLSAYGLEGRPSDGWVTFDITAHAARSLFDAELAWYSFNSLPPVLRTRRYSVPSFLDIDFVHPLAHFMPRRPAPSLESSDVLPSCATGTFPDCIRRLYNINYTATPPSPSRLGVAGFLEQYVNLTDVASFVDTYAPGLAYNLTVNGTNLEDSPGSEASLDVEYAVTLGYPADVVYYSTAGRGVELGSVTSDNEPYLEFLQALLALPDADLPHVLSISYADDEHTVPRPYALRVCDLFAQLAGRGVSVLAASGDGGASGNGQNCGLIPTFPASCPWVTAVGGVENEDGTAASFSSGGISNYFPRPAYQDAVVGRYTNFSGRAIPDISAIASGFQIYYGGGPSAVQGTSASTPVIAAMIALVNDARLRAGKPSLGWLNPLLYSAQVRRVLTDVTVGESTGCNSSGWAAGKGYDLVTGLGVPSDFGKLLQVLG